MFKNWGHAYEMGLTEIKLFNNRYRELMINKEDI